MSIHRGANAAPTLSSAHSAQHPVSEIVRVRETTPKEAERIARERRARELDEDDLYGNMPFTD